MYALYNQSRRICIFLALLLFVDQTVTYYVYFALLRRLRFDISCMVPDTPRYVFYYGYVNSQSYASRLTASRALILTTQSIIWSMTLFKRKLRSRAGGIMAPVIHLMMRDGAIVFLAICGKNHLYKIMRCKIIISLQTTTRHIYGFHPLLDCGPIGSTYHIFVGLSLEVLDLQ